MRATLSAVLRRCLTRSSSLTLSSVPPTEAEWLAGVCRGGGGGGVGDDDDVNGTVRSVCVCVCMCGGRSV